MENNIRKVSRNRLLHDSAVTLQKTYQSTELVPPCWLKRGRCMKVVAGKADLLIFYTPNEFVKVAAGLCKSRGRPLALERGANRV